MIIGTFYSDVRHYLGDEGEITDVTRPAAVIASFLRSVVGWVTMRQAVEPERTNVTCRKVAGRLRCRGEVHAYLDPESGSILYACPYCGDNGVISGWEETSWNRSPLTRQSMRDASDRRGLN